MSKEKKSDLLSVIRDSVVDAKEYLSGATDIAINVMTDSDALDEVPIVSLAVKTWLIKDVFHKNRVKRNVQAFLTVVKDGDEEKLREFFAELQSNEEYGEEFSDSLVATLIDGEKPIKGEVIGRLVVAAASGKLNMYDLERLTLIVQSAAVPSIHALLEFFHRTAGTLSPQNKRIDEEPLMQAAGFCYRYENIFYVSEEGKLLMEHGFTGYKPDPWM